MRIRRETIHIMRILSDGQLDSADKERDFIPIIDGNCLIINVIPIAASIHLITVVGIYLLTLLAPVNPNTACKKHAIIRAARKDSNQISEIAHTTMATNPAAGQLTLSIELLHRPIIIPQIIPAINQLMRGVQLATAIHRHNGTATKNTANQAGRSYFRDVNMVYKNIQIYKMVCYIVDEESFQIGTMWIVFFP